MEELKRCSRCGLPETHETITFDTQGICNICRQHETKKEIDWKAKKEELDQIVSQYRGKHRYDCLVPFSGGKDSTWTLLYLVREYGLRPLVVRFNHGFLRPKCLEYSKRTLKTLGCDFHEFTPNWRVVQKTMLLSFLEKGDFCWHCHTGIFAYPMQVAVNLGIPLVIWGEPSAEYTAYYGYGEDEEVDEKRFNRYVNLGITAQDMKVRLNGCGVDWKDLSPFTYPREEKLREIGCRSICLGSYVPWDVRSHFIDIKRELNWDGDEVEGVPPEYHYEKIECYLQGVRDYTKWLKRGYARASHLMAIDIRNGLNLLPGGLERGRSYEGHEPLSLEYFLHHVGLKKEEYFEIALSHRVSPWEVVDLEKRRGVLRQFSGTWDFGTWDASAGMPLGDKAKILERWRERNEDLGR